MTTAWVVSVGNELVRGLVIDTNAAFIARRLMALGVDVVGHMAVGDVLDRIVCALELASSQTDLVVVTGGLGPTADDLTRQAIARLLRVDLELRKDVLSIIMARFQQLGRPFNRLNQQQAVLPVGVEILPNRIGTAPGLVCRRDGCTIVAMPGVPSEARQMFEDEVVRLVLQLPGRKDMVLIRLHCFGEPESVIAERLADLMQRGRNPAVDCTVHAGQVTVYVIARGQDLAAAQSLAQADLMTIRSRLGRLIFGEDDQTLAGVVAEGLIRKGIRLAVAESCTGGLIAKLLTDQPGASVFFVGGYVVYSNQTKISELGVSEDLLASSGAVSPEVAKAMACGVRRRCESDYGLAVTGVAGPASLEGRPVGTVFVGIDGPEGPAIEALRLMGAREDIRLRAALAALNMLRLRVGL